MSPSRLGLPSVAVVLPCYNSARFLVRTLESVLAQDYPNLSVIAVDDGSSDNTLDILSRYRERITLLTHPDHANRGQSASANLAMSHAQADLVAFMDHDDIWYPGKIHSQVDAFLQDPRVVMVATNAAAINADEQKLYSFPPFPVSATPLVNSLLLDCFIQTPSQVMVRGAYLNTIGGFDTELVAAADHDLWLRVCERGRCVFVDRPLVGYRIHGSQLSVSRARRMWEDAARVLDKARRRHAYPRHLCRQRSAVLHYRLGQCDLADSRRLHALWHFLRAAWLNPSRAWSELSERLSGREYDR
jgi:glycosyltransferase involved in cell wall biosynthesis